MVEFSKEGGRGQGGRKRCSMVAPLQGTRLRGRHKGEGREEEKCRRRGREGEEKRKRVSEGEREGGRN